MKTNIQVCHEPEECFCDRCCLKIVNDNLCNYISKSSLPPLPAGWCGPWEVSGRYVVGRFQGEELGFALCEIGGAQFLAALLNITHPSPTKEGE